MSEAGTPDPDRLSLRDKLRFALFLAIWQGFWWGGWIAGGLLFPSYESPAAVGGLLGFTIGMCLACFVTGLGLDRPKNSN